MWNSLNKEFSSVERSGEGILYPVGESGWWGHLELDRHPGHSPCGACHFNWVSVCQQPTLALLSQAWVLRARASGQDKALPAGRDALAGMGMEEQAALVSRACT